MKSKRGSFVSFILCALLAVSPAMALAAETQMAQQMQKTQDTQQMPAVEDKLQTQDTHQAQNTQETQEVQGTQEAQDTQNAQEPQESQGVQDTQQVQDSQQAQDASEVQQASDAQEAPFSVSPLQSKSADQTTWEVSSDAELTTALTEIASSSATDVTIVLKENLTGHDPSVAGKHVTIKSTDGQRYSLGVLHSAWELQGDLTLDSVCLQDSTIYANGHTFETTENFGSCGSSDHATHHKLNCLYGGGNNKNVTGDTNIILRGNSHLEWVYGGGLDGDVSGSTNILIDGANVVVGNLFGGGHAKDTKNGKVQGDTNVYIKQGNNGSLFGGGYNEYSKDNAPGAREPARVYGTANVIVGYKGAPPHSETAGQATFAYGGSWHSTVGNVNFQLLDGEWSGVSNSSRDYFGCGYCDTVRGIVSIIADGADMSDDCLYGGGEIGYDMDESYGPIEILNEGKEQYAVRIVCNPLSGMTGANAGSHGDIETVINGDVLIEAQHGDMDYIVLDNEFQGTCIINGTATVRVSGDSNIAQIEGNKNHYGSDGVGDGTGKSLAIYDGCGTKDNPQKTGYLYRLDQVTLQNGAQVLVDSEKFSQFGSTQNPFYSVNNLCIKQDCGLTTRNSSTTLKKSVTIDGGSWIALGYVYVYEAMNSQNGHILFKNYFAIGQGHKNDDDIVKHDAFVSKNDEFVALKSGYTGKFYGNVKLDESMLAFMCPVNVSGNWEGGNSNLRVPAVAAGENYDGTDAGGSIALNIDGTATQLTRVLTTENSGNEDDWKTLKKPTLGDNYITGFTADKTTPPQETFLLGNRDAVLDGYYLKRLEDPGAPNDYFMWQVAKRDIHLPDSINRIPTINAEDKELTVGDEFDPRDDVTATDKEDGDLTDKVEIISNNVDTSKSGTYEVTYKVTDSQGASCVKTIKVVVREKSAPEQSGKPNEPNDSDDPNKPNNPDKPGDPNKPAAADQSQQSGTPVIEAQGKDAVALAQTGDDAMPLVLAASACALLAALTVGVSIIARHRNINTR